MVPAQPTTACAGLPLADALSLVTEAAGRLWTPKGSAALAYLHDRGLSDETIRGRPHRVDAWRRDFRSGMERNTGESLASSCPGSMATA